MKFHLANYRLLTDHQVRAGCVVDRVIVDLSHVLPGHASLQAVYEDWANVEPQLQTLSLGEGGTPVDQVRLLPPSLMASSVFFAGFNYRDHVANMMKVFHLPDDPDPKSIGQHPWHNLKPRNTLCGSGSTVELPTPHVDWEIELAVVIGRAARRVSVKDALAHVAGYSIGIDLSARDRAFRPHAPVESVARMDWIAQKGFEGACPLGPWLTPARQIADPQNLTLKLSVNGVIKQDSNTSEMIFSVAEAISHLSSIVTLSPGDIILTGTPAGTGAERGEALAAGDTVSAVIESIGELVIYCAEENRQ